jgi:glycosidase
VNPEFWQAFIPAMLERARKRGIPNFHIFGEVFTDELDVALLARHTQIDRLPTVLDFAFRSAVVQTLAGTKGTEVLKRLFDADVLYAEQAVTARKLPTFVSNHDVGRLSQFVRTAFPQASDDEVLRRVLLAHAMMFTLRGVPVIYSGDEQGFVSDGNDQDAREDMFPSRVAVYNDNRLLGSNATTAQANFDREHPFFVALAELARLRRAHPALRRGDQIVRHFEESPGIFAITRTDPATQERVLVAFNTSTQDRSAWVEVAYDEGAFTPLRGACEAKVSASGSMRVRVPKLDYIICRSARPQQQTKDAVIRDSRVASAGMTVGQ